MHFLNLNSTFYFRKKLWNDQADYQDNAYSSEYPKISVNLNLLTLTLLEPKVINSC